MVHKPPQEGCHAEQRTRGRKFAIATGHASLGHGGVGVSSKGYHAEPDGRIARSRNTACSCMNDSD